MFVFESLQQASPLDSANIMRVLDEISEIPVCGCSRCSVVTAGEPARNMLALCDKDGGAPADPDFDAIQANMAACLSRFQNVNQADQRFHTFPASINVC